MAGLAANAALGGLGGMGGIGGLGGQAYQILEALAIAVGRPTGAALVLPVFTRAQLGTSLKGVIALALSFPAALPIMHGLRAQAFATPVLVLLGAKEVLIGLIIGLLVGLPVWSVQAAGEMLDTQRSATQDRQSSPGTGDQDSTTSALLGMTAITVFVMAGGLAVLARTIDDSYVVWPPLALLPLSASGWGPFLLGTLDRLMRVGLGLAAPVMLGMLLCEACVILLMRAVPKLHMYDLAPTLRNLMFVVMMVAYVGYMVVFMRKEVETIAGVGAALRLLLP